MHTKPIHDNKHWMALEQQNINITLLLHTHFNTSSYKFFFAVLKHEGTQSHVHLKWPSHGS